MALKPTIFGHFTHSFRLFHRSTIIHMYFTQFQAHLAGKTKFDYDPRPCHVSGLCDRHLNSKPTPHFLVLGSRWNALNAIVITS